MHRFRRLATDMTELKGLNDLTRDEVSELIAKSDMPPQPVDLFFHLSFDMAQAATALATRPRVDVGAGAKADISPWPKLIAKR